MEKNYNKEFLEVAEKSILEESKLLVNRYIKPSSKLHIKINDIFSETLSNQVIKSIRNNIAYTYGAKKMTESDYFNELKLLATDLNNDFMDENSFFNKTVKTLYSKYNKYKNNIKNNLLIHEDTGYKHDFEDFKNFEAMDDYFTELNKFSRVTRFGKSLVKSYKHLFDPNILIKPSNEKIDNELVKKINVFSETYDLLDAIYEQKVDRKFIESSLSKIASFKEPEDFNNALKQIMNSNKFNVEKLKSLIESENLDAEIIYSKDNKVAVKINSYNDSSVLGSSEWCISYSETYYDEYLNKIDESSLYNNFVDNMEDLGIESETLNSGVHVFYYDFNKEEDNSLSKIAFTIGANSNVTAAFDKGDSCIYSEIENIIGSQELSEIKKNTLPYIKDNISKLSNPHTDYLYDDGELFTGIYFEQRNPVHEWEKIVKELNDANNFIEIRLRSFEIDIIYKDQIDFKDFNNIEFIDKIFTIKNYIDTSNNMLKEEYETEFIEQNNSDNLIYNMDFLNIYNELNDFQKTLLFKKHESEFVKLFDDEKSKKMNYRFNEENEFNSSDFIKAPWLIDFSIHNFDKNDNSLFNQLVVKSAVFSGKETTKDVDDIFIDMITNNRINMNIIFDNSKILKPEILKDISDIINKNPKEYFKWFNNNKTFHAMSECNDIIDNLSKESIKALSKCVELSDIKIRKNTEYKNDTTFEYPNRMKKLFDMGILNDEIIKVKFDMFSGMAISEEDILYKETGMKLEGYIKSSATSKNKNKLKL